MAGVVRLFHKGGSNGARIVALSDFEYRVWFQYVLSADDYGVMRASATVLQADNLKLEQESTKKVEQAMAAILKSGLVQTFVHQGVTYWWQRDWQDYQQVQYPKDTILPRPSDAVVAVATASTQVLFSVHALPSKDRQEVLRAWRKQFKNGSRNHSGTVSRNDSGKVLEPLQSDGALVPAHVRACETQTHTHTQTQTQTDREVLPEESARETALAHARPIRPARSRSILGGSHIGCFFAPDACARGICVPSWLGQEWLQQFGDREDGLREIAAMVQATLVRLPDGPVGDEPKAFWRAAWRARHGAVASSRSGSRTGDSFEAAKSFLSERVATLTGREGE